MKITIGTREVDKIERNLAKLKKETNIETVKGIGESYQVYEETNARLSKQVRYLDEEVHRSPLISIAGETG